MERKEGLSAWADRTAILRAEREPDMDRAEAAAIVNADYLDSLASLLERGDLAPRPELMPGPKTAQSWRVANAFVLRAMARQIRTGRIAPISILTDTAMEPEDAEA